MVFFKSEDGYKTNFVDRNNLLVGFDSYQCCCEDFGWYFSSTCEYKTTINKNQFNDVERDNSNDLSEIDVSDFYFINEEPNEIPNTLEYDDGGIVSFRLSNQERKDSFSCLIQPS